METVSSNVPIKHVSGCLEFKRICIQSGQTYYTANITRMCQNKREIRRYHRYIHSNHNDMHCIIHSNTHTARQSSFHFDTMFIDKVTLSIVGCEARTHIDSGLIHPRILTFSSQIDHAPQLNGNKSPTHFQHNDNTGHKAMLDLLPFQASKVPNY